MSWSSWLSTCTLLYNSKGHVKNGTSKDQGVRRFGHHKVSRERFNAAGENGQAPRRERCIAKSRSVDSSRHNTGPDGVVCGVTSLIHQRPRTSTSEKEPQEGPGRLRGRESARCRSLPGPVVQHDGCHDCVADGTYVMTLRRDRDTRSSQQVRRAAELTCTDERHRS